MKQLKRPTRRQKIELEKRGLKPKSWYVERDTPEILVVVSKKGYRRTYVKKEA